MADSFFDVVQESPRTPDLGRYRATAATVGPWSEGVQHGGPPSALLVRAAERAARASVDGEVVGRDVGAVRLAAEFLSPVPVSAVEISTSVIRVTRTVVLVDAVLRADGRDCLRAHVWLTRRPSLGVPVAGAAGQEPTPAPSELPRFGFSPFPYAEHVDWRTLSGTPHSAALGPAAVWTRPRIPLVPGETVSALQRCALVGDSASGVSAELAWEQWSFPNIDLDLHLVRQVVGEWVCIDAATQVGGEGIALARSTLSDVDGVVGGSLQTLVVRPRTPTADGAPGRLRGDGGPGTLAR